MSDKLCPFCESDEEFFDKHKENCWIRMTEEVVKRSGTHSPQDMVNAWNHRQEPNQWISCETEMPKSGENIRVLVLLGEEWYRQRSWSTSYEERVVKAWWSGPIGCFGYEEIENANHAVTHWQPLPSAPTKTVIEELS